MVERGNSIDVIETRIEKTSIVLTAIGVVFLIVDQYAFSALCFITVVYVCYNFFRNGLIMISFEKDIIQFKCLKNFRIKRGEFLPSELNENSLIIIKKITGLTSYQELVLVKDKEVLFKDSVMNVYSLGDEKRDYLIEKISLLVNQRN